MMQPGLDGVVNFLFSCLHRTTASVELLASQNGNSSLVYYFNDEKQSSPLKEFTSTTTTPINIRYGNGQSHLTL
jgi:hypothetical protein